MLVCVLGISFSFYFDIFFFVIFVFVFYFFFFNDTATTEIYTLSYTTLFRSVDLMAKLTAMVVNSNLWLA